MKNEKKVFGMKNIFYKIWILKKSFWKKIFLSLEKKIKKLEKINFSDFGFQLKSLLFSPFEFSSSNFLV